MMHGWRIRPASDNSKKRRRATGGVSFWGCLIKAFSAARLQVFWEAGVRIGSWAFLPRGALYSWLWPSTLAAAWGRARMLNLTGQDCPEYGRLSADEGQGLFLPGALKGGIDDLLADAADL